MNSNELYQQACNIFPGGVNSPVRAFKSVGGTPVFFSRGRGSRLWDVEGREYLDFVGSWGALILGHCPENVIRVLHEQAEIGTSFGACTAWENELGQAIQKGFPNLELLRFVSTGTEAVQSSLRLARAYTGRSHIVKFEGAYHGHVDSLLVKAGSGVATQGIADSLGVPEDFARTTFVVPYNDFEAIEKLFKEQGENIAALIVEPISANMGLVLPEPGFLKFLESLCRQYGALLIFDEVITGFRLCYGGYQHLVGVEPDLTCLGKIIGGGLPAAAYGGRKEIMDWVSPLGGVYQAGTLSGNPLAMRAGLATLDVLADAENHKNLEELGRYLEKGVATILADRRDVQFRRMGSMFCFFFKKGQVRDFNEVLLSNRERYAEFFHFLLDQGFYFPPSPFETSFLSAAHTISDIDRFLEAVQSYFNG